MRVAPLAEAALSRRLDDAPHFLVGRAQRAGWVVTEIHGRCGGYFCDEASALRYAKEESGGDPEAIEFADRPIDLDLSVGAPSLYRPSRF